MGIEIREKAIFVTDEHRVALRDAVGNSLGSVVSQGLANTEELDEEMLQALVAAGIEPENAGHEKGSKEELYQRLGNGMVAIKRDESAMLIDCMDEYVAGELTDKKNTIQRAVHVADLSGKTNAYNAEASKGKQLTSLFETLASLRDVLDPADSREQIDN